MSCVLALSIRPCSMDSSPTFTAETICTSSSSGVPALTVMLVAAVAVDPSSSESVRPTAYWPEVVVPGGTVEYWWISAKLVVPAA